MNTENQDTARENKDAAAAAPEAGKTSGPAGDSRHSYKKGGPRKAFKKRDTTPSEFVEKVIAINRVTKVTKGGKRLAFSALVVVGDTKGRVGYGLQKAGEVAAAIKKSLTAAKKSMVRIALHESTIPHQILGTCGGAVVMLKPASEGTGVIAAGPVRAVCDSVGIRNILTKCHRSNNPINVVKATVDGLSRLKPRVATVPQTAAVESGK